MSERFQSEFERELSASLRPAAAPDFLWSRIEANLDPRPARRLLPVAMGLMAAISLSAAWYAGRPDPAVVIHREFVEQPARLDVVKCQPAELHDWVARNTGLALTLAARPQPDSSRVELVGARRVGEGKAAVFYRIAGHPVTLLVSRASNQAAPAKSIRQALSDGLKLYAWDAHGQHYTLVSSLPGSSRQECGICHVGGTTRG